jgi:glycine/D-amino acid oxidase-like deaminating enzyme
VVIGAGIVGASAAAARAAARRRVPLLDQEQPGQGTSRWSFAWVNSNDKAPRAYHELNHAGIRAWAELAPDLDGAAWHRPSGHLELAAGPEAAGLEARVRRLAGWGYPARLVSLAEAARIEPALRLPPGAAAAFFPEEGYLLTGPLIARLVARAESRGAQVRTGKPGRVTGLEPGAPARVRTADGTVREADDVVLCAGRWTPALAAVAAVVGPVPASPVPASPVGASPVPLIPWDTSGSAAPGLVVRAGPVAPDGPARLLHAPGIALRPHALGLLHLESDDATAAVDLHTPEPALRSWADELLGRARRTVRGLDGARVADFKVCVRPLPADGQSIVGRLPGADGIYIAVTHSGVTLAARLAALIAEDLVTGTPPLPLAPYAPSRFSSHIP